MTIYYKDGFYDDTSGGYVPEGAVEISEEKYLELLMGNPKANKSSATNKASLC